MNSLAIYPGSFDPLTFGHIDLVKRAARVFARLILAISKSVRKKPLFTIDERVDMARQVTKDMPNVEVDVFDGLLVNYAQRKGCRVLIRGVRAFSDFEDEFQMALTNRKMAPEVETLFMMPNESFSYVSSGLVREIAGFGGDISKFAPDSVQTTLAKKITEKQRSVSGNQ